MSASRMEPLLALVQTGEAGTSSSMRLMELPAAWLLVLFVLPLFALVAYGGYLRSGLPTPARLLLGSLRFGALLLLLLVLSRPVRVERQEQVHAPQVLALLDDSASMQRRDSYGGDPGVRERLRELTGGDPSQAMRLELVGSALQADLLNELSERGYELELHGFAENLARLESPTDLQGSGAVTHLGDAVTRALAAARGRHLTDILVISDGRSNGGLPMLDSARAAAAAGIPTHTVVVGDTRPERNAFVEVIEVPSSTLEGDEVEVSVRVVGRGIPGGALTDVVLEELPARGRSSSARTVAVQEVLLSEAGERVSLIAPPAPPEAGSDERRFRVVIPPIAGETLTDDNQLSFGVHVSTQKVRVLYVDGYPRWEYRYLKNLLLRADANFEVQCFLLSATSNFLQESSPDLPSLRSVPATREELLENYDVVILGDVPPHAVSADPERARQFLVSLREFVEGGGGLLFQAGEFDNPRAYRGSPLEDLLPVMLSSGGVNLYDVDTTREVRPVLEEPSMPHEIVRLSSDLDLNRRLWEDPDGLRGFYWYFPVERAKPGTQVLLRHPSEGNNHGRLPLAVAGYFPEGRTLFLAIDSTWMWRYHFGDRYHERFWRNSIRWLALGRLKSGDRRYRLETSRSTYDLEERVLLEARILDEDFRASDEPSQEMLLAGPDGRPEVVVLTASDAQPGIFRAALAVERPGLYRAWIEVDGRPASSAEFEVVLPTRENAEPAPDPAALSSLSSLTGGRALSLDRLGELLDEFPGEEERREPISSRLEDAWDRWLTLFLALGLVSAEWILRKRMELV